MTKLTAEMGPQHNRLFGWRFLETAKIDMLRRGYPLHVMQIRITLSSVKKTIKFIEGSEPKKFVKMWDYGNKN